MGTKRGVKQTGCTPSAMDVQHPRTGTYIEIDADGGMQIGGLMWKGKLRITVLRDPGDGLLVNVYGYARDWSRRVPIDLVDWREYAAHATDAGFDPLTVEALRGVHV